VDPGAIGKFFLTPAFLVSKAAQVGGKALADVHLSGETPLSPIDLQTMSDIRLDPPGLSGFDYVTHK
jgi:hypothetical protein